MATLLEEVTGGMEQQARKHDLGEDHAAEQVNAMTHYELLTEISEAIERMRITDVSVIEWINGD